MSRLQWRVVRNLPLLRRESPRLNLPEPETSPLRCDCDEPDVQPVGSWLPPTITACARCGRPL